MECLDATLYYADSSQLLEQETQLTLNWKNMFLSMQKYDPRSLALAWCEVPTSFNNNMSKKGPCAPVK